MRQAAGGRRSSKEVWMPVVDDGLEPQAGLVSASPIRTRAITTAMITNGATECITIHNRQPSAELATECPSATCDHCRWQHQHDLANSKSAICKVRDFGR